jgi:hypothetical protein
MFLLPGNKNIRQKGDCIGDHTVFLPCKEKEREVYVQGVLFEKLHIFEKILKLNNGGTGYFVGDKLSIADVIVFDSLDMNEHIAPGLLEEYPLLKNFR